MEGRGGSVTPLGRSHQGGGERGGGVSHDDFSGVEISIAGCVKAIVCVRREPISKSCEITQADNLNRRRRLSRKSQ